MESARAQKDPSPLDAIREAEVAAGSRLERARREAQSIVELAVRRVDKLREQIREEAVREAAARRELSGRGIEAEILRLEREAAGERQGILELSSLGHDRAVEVVLSLVLGQEDPED